MFHNITRFCETFSSDKTLSRLSPYNVLLDKSLKENVERKKIRSHLYLANLLRPAH